jgi:hypothetical protein
MRFTENIILNIPTLATTTSASIDLSNIVAFSIQFTWTGTPTGTVSINASCDGTNWTLIPNSSAATGGAAGNFLVNYFEAGFRYIQAVYTNTSGTGTVIAVYNGKGV